MNSEQYLSDIYRDFFGEYDKRKDEIEKVSDVNYEEEISKCSFNSFHGGDSPRRLRRRRKQQQTIMESRELRVECCKFKLKSESS